MRINLKKNQQKQVPRYIVFTEVEILFLIICVILDVTEYVVAILLLPVFGDILDIAGIFGSILMFKWLGIISILGAGFLIYLALSTIGAGAIVLGVKYCRRDMNQAAPASEPGPGEES